MKDCWTAAARSRLLPRPAIPSRNNRRCPPPGILVKGCLDDCDVCEPTLMKGIELDLEHKRLQNELLKKQIDLLEKSQEYRCCPAGETADNDEDA